MFESIETLVAGFESGRLSRRELVATLAAVAAAGCRVAAAQREEGRGGETRPGAPIPVRGYSHAALKVSNVARSRDFYRDHFGMRVTSDGERSAFLTMGGPFLALFAAGAGHSEERRPGLDHLAFSVEGWESDAMVARLRERGLEPWTQERRVYFRDPDGIILQLSP